MALDSEGITSRPWEVFEADAWWAQTTGTSAGIASPSARTGRSPKFAKGRLTLLEEDVRTMKDKAASSAQSPDTVVSSTTASAFYDRIDAHQDDVLSRVPVENEFNDIESAFLQRVQIASPTRPPSPLRPGSAHIRKRAFGEPSAAEHALPTREAGMITEAAVGPPLSIEWSEVQSAPQHSLAISKILESAVSSQIDGLGECLNICSQRSRTLKLLGFHHLHFDARLRAYLEHKAHSLGYLLVDLLLLARSLFGLREQARQAGLWRQLLRSQESRKDLRTEVARYELVIKKNGEEAQCKTLKQLEKTFAASSHQILVTVYLEWSKIMLAEKQQKLMSASLSEQQKLMNASLSDSESRNAQRLKTMQDRAMTSFMTAMGTLPANIQQKAMSHWRDVVSLKRSRERQKNQAVKAMAVASATAAFIMQVLLAWKYVLEEQKRIDPETEQRFRRVRNALFRDRTTNLTSVFFAWKIHSEKARLLNERLEAQAEMQTQADKRFSEARRGHESERLRFEEERRAFEEEKVRMQIVHEETQVLTHRSHEEHRRRSVVEMKQSASRALEVTAAMRNRGLVQMCFLNWEKIAADMQQKRHEHKLKVKRVMASIADACSHCLNESFKIWTTARETRQAAEEAFETKLRFIQKFFISSGAALLAKALDGWQSQIAEIHRVRNMKDVAMGRCMRKIAGDEQGLIAHIVLLWKNRSHREKDGRINAWRAVLFAEKQAATSDRDLLRICTSAWSKYLAQAHLRSKNGERVLRQIGASVHALLQSMLMHWRKATEDEKRENKLKEADRMLQEMSDRAAMEQEENQQARFRLIARQFDASDQSLLKTTFACWSQVVNREKRKKQAFVWGLKQMTLQNDNLKYQTLQAWREDAVAEANKRNMMRIAKLEKLARDATVEHCRKMGLHCLRPCLHAWSQLVNGAKMALAAQAKLGKYLVANDENMKSAIFSQWLIVKQEGKYQRMLESAISQKERAREAFVRHFVHDDVTVLAEHFRPWAEFATSRKRKVKQGLMSVWRRCKEGDDATLKM
jgi:hypothetical protein